jgi:hypothetical protein
LLKCALDHGITHFDTAPYYGFGVSEQDLGVALVGVSNATIATKVGIYPPGRPSQSSAEVLFRKSGGKILPFLSRPSIDWTVARARKSLDQSLRHLRKDFVDLLLLHEAEVHLLATDEWCHWLESERSRVSAFGIACASDRVLPFLSGNHPLAKIIQCSDSVDRREADVVLRAGRPLQITFGYLGGPRSEPSEAPEQLLAAALRRNATGCVLVSTSREDRIGLLAAIAEQDQVQNAHRQVALLAATLP